MSARRARRLPAKVRPFRRIVSPVERSAGTRPRKDISCLGVSNRRVADLPAKHTDEKRGAAHRLVGFHDRRPRPLRHDESELFLEATQALNRIFDRVDPFLKDDLLRGMFELLVGQPAPMRHRPVAASAVNPAVPQQKGKQLLALATKIVSRGLAGADKIAHSFVGGVRCPHARQFAGPMQPRQRNRISPVRFDPLARPFRDQSRSDHHAFVAERLDLPIKPVSRRPGFKTNMQPIVSARGSFSSVPSLI